MWTGFFLSLLFFLVYKLSLTKAFTKNFFGSNEWIPVLLHEKKLIERNSNYLYFYT